MLNILRLLLTTFVIIPPCTMAMEQARITQDEITNISHVINHINNLQEHTLVVFDWDRTITYKNGEDTAGLREGSLTLETIRCILKKEYDFFILTARWCGYSLEQLENLYTEYVIKNENPSIGLEPSFYGKTFILEQMDKMLQKTQINHLLSKNRTAFNFDDSGSLKCREFQLTGTIPITAIITPHIVLSGSTDGVSRKGPTLCKILDENSERLRQMGSKGLLASNKIPDHVIFLDDDIENINSVRIAFQNRNERLTLLHYPSKK